MHKKEYSLHTLCLSAIFLIGNAAIIIPYKGSDRNTLLGFIIAFVLAIPAFAVVSLALNRFKKPDSAAVVVILRLAGVLAAVLVIWGAAVCFRDYLRFVSRDILPNTPNFIIGIVIAVCIAVMSTSPRDALLKFSLFSFFLTAAIIIALFIASLPRLNPDAVVLLRFPEISEIYSQTKPYFLTVFIPALPVLLYEKQCFGKVRIKRSLLGLVLGSAVLSLCLIGSLMLFGAPVAGEIEFPYAASISTVTIGNLFTRMDGFAYFVYFAGCIIKVAASVFVAEKLLLTEAFKYKKTACIFCTAAVMIISYIIK